MEAFSVLSVALPVQTKLIHLETFCSHKTSHSRGSARKILQDYKRYGSVKNVDAYASIVGSSSRKGLPLTANERVLGLQSEGFLPEGSTLTALMRYYANNGFFAHAHALWNEIIHSSYNMDIHVVLDLIDAYIRVGLFDKVTSIVRQVGYMHPHLQHEVYVHTILCFGKIGELDLMETTLKHMVAKGFPVDSAIGNAYVVYYSRFGSISMMEKAYKRLKSSRLLIEKDGIRAVSLAYIREKKFHDLGSFLRDVGLGRRNSGNLVWNLLLLSYAYNFKMKSLQREFINMVEAGFDPDLTTFNIRAVAFSKMSLFWDLHLSIEHMIDNGVLPDLVTYGCVVDAYLDRRLGRNLEFVLRKMNVKDSAVVLTDEIVFEVLGKGGFQSSSEAVVEYERRRRWSYEELIATYVKKRYRSNQVFWNY